MPVFPTLVAYGGEPLVLHILSNSVQYDPGDQRLSEVKPHRQPGEAGFADPFCAIINLQQLAYRLADGSEDVFVVVVVGQAREADPSTNLVNF